MKKIYSAFAREKFFVFFTLLILSLFFINRHMYTNRFNGYLYTEGINYNEFSIPAETYHIHGFNKNVSDLQLNISPLPGSTIWQVTDSKGGSYKTSGELPTIKLIKGTETYTVSSANSEILKPIELVIEHDAGADYTCVLNCSMPIIEYELFPVARWTRLNANISEAEISEVKRILKEEIKISDSDHTAQKIEKIGTFLITKLRTFEGGPSNEMKEQTPLTQYNWALSKKSEIDCAIYTDVYHLFANCAGVPTRKIGIHGDVNYITTTGHVFNESYIKEQGKWAFVDLTSKKLMVLNSSKNVLNTIDLLNAKNTGNPEGKTAIFVTAENKIDSVPYEKINQSENQYFKENAAYYIIKDNINNNMNFSESFEEYQGTTSHFGAYYNGTFKIDNSRYYLQTGIFKLSVILSGIWALVLTGKIIGAITRRFTQKTAYFGNNGAA